MSPEAVKGATALQNAPSDNGSSLKSSKPADSIAAEPVRGCAASNEPMPLPCLSSGALPG